jgi:hypothetical protein
MANKTPGEVAWEAYRSALMVWTPGPPAGEDYISPAWEAAATAVRHQLGCQNRTDELVSAHLIRDVGMIRDIRKVIHEWRTIDPDFTEGGYYDCDAIKAIAAILDPDEPTPEEAEACAEDAGAEQSKSPPPAER